jgi:hypothetical protein
MLIKETSCRKKTEQKMGTSTKRTASKGPATKGPASKGRDTKGPATKGPFSCSCVESPLALTLPIIQHNWDLQPKTITQQENPEMRT